MKVDRKGLKVTLGRLRRVFLDIGLLKRQLMAANIAHQLVAGTYNVPTPSHIIRSVLISYVRENPAMTAEVTPEGLYNHNVCTIMWHYTVRWMFGTGTRVGYRTLRQMGVS